MKKSCFLSALFFCASFIGPAMALDFTYLNPGARANGVGTAFSSIANDPYAIFYNPAGLSYLKNMEIRTGMGRHFSPVAAGGQMSATYVRPVPDTRNKTAGFGYYGIRQAKTGKRDSAIFGVGNSVNLKYLQMPVLYGGSFRVESIRTPEKGHLGIGFDAGAIFESNSGLKTALALSDVSIGLGRSMTTLIIGNSYRYLDSVFALDLRVRGSHSELFYGLERDFSAGLLQMRLGKGTALNGVDALAFGIGLNMTPWIVDFAASIPWKGFQDCAGMYEINIGYRFGAPSYSEKFVGDAGARAGTLKSQIDELRSQKATLENAIATYRVNKGVLEADVTMMQSRMREMETRLKDLELELIEAQHRKEAPQPKKVIVQPKPEKWPRLYKVLPGDTLRSIASKHYGNPNLWERIYDANEKNISKGLPIEGAIFEIPAPPPPSME